MMQRPNCDCHDEPQWWHSHWSRRKAQPVGAWRCSVKERERRRRRWWKDPIGEAAKKDQARRQKRINRFENELKELLDA